MRKIAFSKEALSKAMLANWMIGIHYERQDDAYQDARRWLIVLQVSPSGLWIAVCPTAIPTLGTPIKRLRYIIAAHPNLDGLLQTLWNDYKFIASWMMTARSFMVRA